MLTLKTFAQDVAMTLLIIAGMVLVFLITGGLQS
jgi:hypothetical protein